MDAIQNNAQEGASAAPPTGSASQPSMRNTPLNAVQDNEKEDVEMQLLLEGIFRCYGFDFREYSPGSLKRRILYSAHEQGVATISGLQEKVLHDPSCMQRLLLALSINVTAMYRDPSFYLAFRNKVAPRLRDLPSVRIWLAGCSTGEEAYSMAILLKEEGLYEKSRIYATDMNEVVIAKAQEGIFPLAPMRENTANYLAAGGRGSFAEFYTARYDHAILHADLRRNILFTRHNLVTDASFNEFHVILCRNVMIYFNRPLQAHVHGLLYESLQVSGVLGLGMKESLMFSPHEADYEELDGPTQLYRKVR
jgi:chemotaxis protein methyltransferase CheR